jgi:pimeloyl-ACP methyl ester carboxylesterase
MVTIAPADECRFLERPDGARLAHVLRAGRQPGVVFLGGLRSSMEAVKAKAIEAHCRAEGRAVLRFDHFGHGRSDGRFEDGTIGRWADDAVAMLDHATNGPQILVGSSLGGWLALLAAVRRPDRIAGVLCLSAAADFTEHLEKVLFGEAQRRQLGEQGLVEIPDCHGGAAFAITRALIEEGRRHLLLERAGIAITAPVRLLHGQQDRDVPWQTSVRLAERIAGGDVKVILIKDADHELARAQDIACATHHLDELIAQAQ